MYKSRQCSILVVRQLVYCCVPAGIIVFDIQQRSSTFYDIAVQQPSTMLSHNNSVYVCESMCKDN